MIFVVLAAVLLGSLANGYGVFDQGRPPKHAAVIAAPTDTTEPAEPDTSRADAMTPAREFDE